MTGFSKWADSSPDETVAAAACSGLTLRLEAVGWFLERAASRPEESSEYVHQTRVWSRRAGAALALYAPVLPAARADRMATHLKRVRHATNDARDDDVFAERLAAEKDDPGARQLLHEVLAHRRRAQKAVLAIYGKMSRNERFARRAEKLIKRVGRKKRAAIGEQRFGNWADQQMRIARDEFFAAAGGDLSDVEGLHSLRIAGKKLRYTLELLASALGAPLRERVYPMVKDLQDRLGQLNDQAIAHSRLTHWLAQLDAPQACDYLQRQLAAGPERGAQLRDEFLAWWNGAREAELRQAFAETLEPAQPA